MIRCDQKKNNLEGLLLLQLGCACIFTTHSTRFLAHVVKEVALALIKQIH